MLGLNICRERKCWWQTVHLDVQVQKIQQSTLTFRSAILSNWVFLVSCLIWSSRVDQIKQDTWKDPVLKRLMVTMVTGWSDKRKDLPKQLQPYWSFRDDLSVEDGLVLKGERVIIPSSLNNNYLPKWRQICTLFTNTEINNCSRISRIIVFAYIF